MIEKKRIVSGASWPAVASAHERLRWIIQILKDEGVSVTGDTSEYTIIRSFLEHVYTQPTFASDFRLLAFRCKLLFDEHEVPD